MPPSATSADARGEILWKWMLRIVGVATFIYILLVMKGDAPAAVFVIVGGLIGLPNVVSLQQALNQRREAPELPTTDPSEDGK
jgi:hypothetical protein